MNRHNDMNDQLLNRIKDQLVRLRTKYEPSARNLLGTNYTDEECTLIFHSDTNRTLAKQAAELRCAIDDRNAATRATRARLEEAASLAMDGMRQALLVRRKRQRSTWGRAETGRRNKDKGVRPDAVVRRAKHPDKEWWIDVTTAHDHSDNAAKRERLLSQLMEQAEAPKRAFPPPTTCVIRARESLKIHKFKMLTEAADYQHEMGNRPAPPHTDTLCGHCAWRAGACCAEVPS